jgi:Cu/Ag efflux pump CusA
LALVKLARRIQQLMAIVILAGIFTSTFLNMIVSTALYLMKYSRAEAPAPARDYLQGTEFAPSGD